jgi:hypothetical protein
MNIYYVVGAGSKDAFEEESFSRSSFLCVIPQSRYFISLSMIESKHGYSKKKGVRSRSPSHVYLLRGTSVYQPKDLKSGLVAPFQPF